MFHAEAHGFRVKTYNYGVGMFTTEEGNIKNNYNGMLKGIVEIKH